MHTAHCLCNPTTLHQFIINGTHNGFRQCLLQTSNVCFTPNVCVLRARTANECGVVTCDTALADLYINALSDASVWRGTNREQVYLVLRWSSFNNSDLQTMLKSLIKFTTSCITGQCRWILELLRVLCLYVSTSGTNEKFLGEAACAGFWFLVQLIHVEHNSPCRWESRSSLHLQCFCGRHCSDSPSAGKATDWTWKEQVDMVKWSRSPIQASLLKFESPQINKLAIECFIGANWLHIPVCFCLRKSWTDVKGTEKRKWQSAILSTSP